MVMSDPDEFMIPNSPDDLSPTSEMRLTRIDDRSNQVLFKQIFETGWIEDPVSHRSKKVITGYKYKGLAEAYSHACNHLNGEVYYMRQHAEAEIMYWEGLFYDPLCLEYENNTPALRILDALNLTVRRTIKNSIRGKGQDYQIKMSGSHRTQEFKKSEQ